MNYYQIKVTTNETENFIFFEKLIDKPFKTIFLPKKIKHFAFIKSPHVNSASKEHFKFCKYHRLYYTQFSVPSLKLFLINLPNNFQIRIKNLNN